MANVYLNEYQDEIEPNIQEGMVAEPDQLVVSLSPTPHLGTALL